MKKIILPIGAIALILCIFVTSAFTSISASRNAEIDVVDDTNALLSLQPCIGANGAYFVDSNSDGKYELKITDAMTGANLNAQIYIKDIFSITNNGSGPVTVTITDTGAYPSNTSFGAFESGVILNVGQSANVSLTIDTQGIPKNVSIIDSITISAVAIV